MNARYFKEESLVRGLVSVIIPVYKVEKYVQVCLSSIVRQSYKNIEIILVDDAGEDDSMKLAEAVLQGADVSWRVIKHACNKGVSVARNNGADCAKGEFIFFMDSDDYISDTCIEKLVKSAYDNQSDIVFGSFVYDMGGQIESSHWMYSEDRSSRNPLYEHVIQNAYVMPWNKLIKRGFYIRSGVKFKEGIRYEDEPWAFSLILRATKISFVKDILYYYRIWDGSYMSGIKLDEFRVNSMYYHLKNCSQESFQFDIWKLDYFRTWYARIIFLFCTNVLDSQLSKSQKLYYLDKVYGELRLPNEELDDIFLYPMARRLSFMLPNYLWLVLLVKYKKIKRLLFRK